MGRRRAPQPEALALAARVFLATGAAIILLLHPLRPDYDPARRYLSEFAVGPYGPLMALAFVALGLALLALAGALAGALVGAGAAAGTGGAGLTLAGVVLLGLAGLGMVVTGLFPTDLSLPGTPQTRPGAIHNRAAGVAFQGAQAAMATLTLSLSFGRASRWRSWRSWRLPAAGLTGAAFLAYFVLYGAALWGWPGWPQRALLGAIVAWLWLTAGRLRAAPPASA